VIYAVMSFDIVRTLSINNTYDIWRKFIQLIYC